MQKSFKLVQAFMNNVEKNSNCIFKSGRLSLLYFEYVNTLFRSLSSQNIENQQLTPAKYTVLMLRVRQNWCKKDLAGLRHAKSWLFWRYCLYPHETV